MNGHLEVVHVRSLHERAKKVDGRGKNDSIPQVANTNFLVPCQCLLRVRFLLVTLCYSCLSFSLFLRSYSSAVSQ
jgi:hypothetical protein